MKTSQITIEYYGRLAAARGKNQEILSAKDFNNLSQIFDYLKNMNISLVDCATAINDELVAPDSEIKAGDIIALLPPVSGG